MSKTCFAGIKLVIRVVEDSDYAKKWANEEVPSNVYSFKFALSPDCPGYPQGLVEASDKGQWLSKYESELFGEGQGFFFLTMDGVGWTLDTNYVKRKES